jgi:hypothetical protein
MARANISHAWLHYEKIYRRESQSPRGLAAKNGQIRRGKVGLELQGGHNDGFLASGAHYRRGLAEFLASLELPGQERQGRPAASGPAPPH